VAARGTRHSAMYLSQTKIIYKLKKSSQRKSTSTKVNQILIQRKSTLRKWTKVFRFPIPQLIGKKKKEKMLKTPFKFISESGLTANSPRRYLLVLLTFFLFLSVLDEIFFSWLRLTFVDFRWLRWLSLTHRIWCIINYEFVIMLLSSTTVLSPPWRKFGEQTYNNKLHKKCSNHHSRIKDWEPS